MGVRRDPVHPALAGNLVGGVPPVPLLPAPVPATIGPALAAVLGSEDSLFRDPFADFVPSSR
jgi:hypothetical protein